MSLRKLDPKALTLAEKPREASNAAVWAERLYASDDEKQFHGVWQAAPGVHADLPGQETVVILEGRATVTNGTGESIDVGPGDLVFIDAGDVTTWTVHEQLRKFFVINQQ